MVEEDNALLGVGRSKSVTLFVDAHNGIDGLDQRTCSIATMFLCFSGPVRLEHCYSTICIRSVCAYGMIVGCLEKVNRERW